MEGEITAVIPAYNAEQFLAKAIESVLEQTRPASNVIVVDDCSTDGTERVAKKYSDVAYLRTPVNSGHAKARNLAIAGGENTLHWMVGC